MMRAALVPTLTALSGCLGPDIVTLEELRDLPGVEVSVTESMECQKREGLCWPIIDDEHRVPVITVELDLGALGDDVALARLPDATINGVEARSRWEGATRLTYRWHVDPQWTSYDVALVDDTDVWRVGIPAKVPHDVEIVLPPTPDAGGPPTLHVGDPLVALVSPAPAELVAATAHLGRGFAPRPAVSVSLTLDEGSLSYDATTGALEGRVPALPDGTDPSCVELAISGRAPRALTCDGPSSCGPAWGSGFSGKASVCIARPGLPSGS